MNKAGLIAALEKIRVFTNSKPTHTVVTKKSSIKKKTLKELRAECKEKNQVYDLKGKDCRDSKRKKKSSNKKPASVTHTKKSSNKKSPRKEVITEALDASSKTKIPMDIIDMIYELQRPTPWVDEGKVEERVLGMHTDTVHSVARLTDNLVVSGSDDTTVRVWDVESGNVSMS